MNIKVKAIGMGFNNTGYPGAFTPIVERIIGNLIKSPCLNLFSGQSMLGDERIDIEHSNATISQDVKKFILEDGRDWAWVILDPPYAIHHVDSKLNGYGLKGSVSSDVIFRRNLKQYLQYHASNILWLDYCAPMIKGFRREQLWLLLPGGFHSVRVLSWLVRNCKPMELLLK